jgi:hypothetical protein
MQTFIEITNSSHQHGGPGWEFGTCLWCPSRDRAGSDRYSVMRAPAPGDEVIHFLFTSDNYITGRSAVKRRVRVVETEPPLPGVWKGMGAYYRIELKSYTPFTNPLPVREFMEMYLTEIREEIATHPKHYPFATYGPKLRTTQGMYLALCTDNLRRLLSTALALQDSDSAERGPDDSGAARPADGPQGNAETSQQEFNEARRLSRERYFFARNRSLARAAKRAQGTACKICGFSFETVYGPLGRDFIEVHHLDQLAERAEWEWSDELRTSLDRVLVVCPNCHRMLHKTRPALSPQQLRTQMVNVDVRRTGAASTSS